MYIIPTCIPTGIPTCIPTGYTVTVDDTDAARVQFGVLLRIAQLRATRLVGPTLPGKPGKPTVDADAVGNARAALL
jgi:hypothetical protein